MSTLRTKNYIQIQVKGTPIHIIGSKPGGESTGSVMFPPAQNLTLPQARAYADAIVRVCNFIGKPKGGRGNPGKVVESNDHFSKRLLFFSDDKHFVTWSRAVLEYDLYSLPVISIDGFVCGAPAAMQASTSIFAAIDDAVTTQKVTRQSIRREMRKGNG